MLNPYLLKLAKKNIGRLMVVAAFVCVALVVSFPEQATSDPKDDEKKAEYTGVGTWTKAGKLKVSRYFAHGAWISKYKCAVVWGGSSRWTESAARKDGQLYHPEDNRWTTMTLEGAPDPRIDAGCTTDGNRFIVWGGTNFKDHRYSFYSSGGIYDPKKNKWTFTSYGGPCDRARPFVGYSKKSKQIVIWGGMTPFRKIVTALKSGATYDLKKHVWKTEITDEGDCPWGRVDFAAVLTDKEMIVWGGHWQRSWPRPNEDYSWNDGAILDLKKNKWRKISAENAPPAHFGMVSVWTGELMLMYGGHSYDGRTNRIYGDQIFAYDPKADKWVTKDAPEKMIAPRESHGAVWTGKKLIVWGGLTVSESSRLEPSNTGGIYDPATNTWEPISPEGAPPARCNHTMIWMEDVGKVLIAGGMIVNDKGENRAVNDCFVYTPPADALPDKEKK